MIAEHDIQSQILEYLQLRHVLVFRNNTGRRGYVRFGLDVGSSDIIGVLPGGRFLAIEVKKPKGGVVSEFQTRFLESVNAHGGLGFVARSLADVEERIK